MYLDAEAHVRFESRREVALRQPLHERRTLCEERLVKVQVTRTERFGSLGICTFYPTGMNDG